MKNHPCPKCHTGKIYGYHYGYTHEVISCHSCGLFHIVGSVKESLHRQIYNHDPRAVDARKEAKQ